MAAKLFNSSDTNSTNDPVYSRYTDVGLSDGGPNPLEDFTLSRDRMAEALKNSKKALKICSQNNPVILGDLLKCYGKLIEVYLKSEKYDDGMKTFEKIKMFNLSSIDAKDVLDQITRATGPALYFYNTLQGRKIEDSLLSTLTGKPLAQAECPSLDSLVKSGRLSQGNLLSGIDKKTVGRGDVKFVYLCSLLSNTLFIKGTIWFKIAVF